MSVHCTTSHQANARYRNWRGPVLRSAPYSCHDQLFFCSGLLLSGSRQKKCSEEPTFTLGICQFLGASPKKGPEAVQSFLSFVISDTIKQKLIHCLWGSWYCLNPTKIWLHLKPSANIGNYIQTSKYFRKKMKFYFSKGQKKALDICISQFFFVTLQGS